MWPSLSLLILISIVACNIVGANQHRQDVQVNLDGTSEIDAPESILGAERAEDHWEDDDLDYGEDIGVRQDLEIDYDRLDEVQDALYLAREYLSTYNFSKYPDHPHLKVDCKNKHQLCGLWSAMGECERNPLFMNTTCAPVCQACEYLLVEVRCPLDPDAVDAWYPDDLQRMFERITMDPQYSPYEPKVVSHPDSRGGQPAGPWIVVLDNFVSESEAERLIALSTEAWNDRPDTITLALDGSNRTHCEASCHDDPFTQALLQRIETLTHVPQANYEHLHMVRFGPGSFPLYTHDHDFDPEEARRQQGVRIFSLFMFLNDLDHGGSLSFPAVNLNITARLGRAVLWPLVLNDDPNRNDNRTAHAGLPFHPGNKYVAHAFAHQRSFFAPHARHCIT